MNNQDIISVNPAAVTLGSANGLDKRQSANSSYSLRETLQSGPDSPGASAISFFLSGNRRVSLKGSFILLFLRACSAAMVSASAFILPALHPAVSLALLICGAALAVGFLSRPAAAIAAALLAIAMPALGFFSANSFFAILICALIASAGGGRFSLDAKLFSAFKNGYNKMMVKRRLSYAAYNYRFH